MSTINLLYKTEIPVNCHIQIHIPTVGEILEDEDAYYGLVSMLTAMPIDYMVQLDDIGVDFAAINEYELFLTLFHSMRELDTSLIFGDLDLSAFVPSVNPQNGMIVLRSKTTGAVIDRAIHGQIAAALRKIHALKQDKRRPGNKEAREFMLSRARLAIQRNKRRKHSSSLEESIVAMVNTEQFPYDFRGVLGLTIYQFNESVRQVIKKIDYDNRMHGIYAGTVNADKLSEDALNWMTHADR